MLRKPAKRRAAGVRRSCAARRACLSRGSGKLPVRSVLTVASATAGSTKAALRQPDPPHALDPRRRDSASASSGTRARRRAAGVGVRALARRGRVPRRFGQAAAPAARRPSPRPAAGGWDARSSGGDVFPHHHSGALAARRDDHAPSDWRWGVGENHSGRLITQLLRHTLARPASQ